MQHDIPPHAFNDETLPERLVDQMITQHPPPLPQVDNGEPQADGRLGAYLLRLGYLSPEQLQAILAEQQQQHAVGKRIVLGELLIQHELINVQVLTAVLMVQMADRLRTAAPHDPARPLGEQLVATGQVSAERLASAIQLQSWLHNQGVQAQLGELLIQQGSVDEKMLKMFVANQQRHRATERGSAAFNQATSEKPEL